MSDAKEYSNAAQERGYDVLLALAGRELTGLAPGELAKGLGISPSCVTRDLNVLRSKGLAEQIAATGRWRLGPKMVQIAIAFTSEIKRRAEEIEEIQQRYTRKPT